ncbi:MAG: transpeptidase family protein [Spirochaetaceae bacterium]|jgi:cell division protein FtsI (penicillin-binding protein 3)|nr:transpeptidase family protein [Spirochaetaceae bacterium]
MTEAENKPKPSYNAKLRYTFFFMVLAASLIYLLARYGHLMLGPQNFNIGKTTRLTVERGPIFDRNGRILAIEARFGNISVWRPAIVKKAELAARLAPLLAISERDIIAQIDQSETDFIYLKKKADQGCIREIESLIEKGMLRGVNIEPVMGRIYPEQSLAAQIIGFVGDENTGLAGVEYSFNAELSAKGSQNEQKAPGNQIFLTIDANIQYILEDIAGKALKKHNAEAVMLMAMDPQTGDILGAASLPGFDPNHFRDSSEQDRMFRPALWSYEPGSVFKIFSLASLLDGDFIRPDTTFFCNGAYQHTTNLGEHIVIKCLGAHGTVNARDIIIYSCNAGAAYASDTASSGAFYNTIRQFGFGSRTASGLSGETAGFLRAPARWSERTKQTISMGQEIAVSAMQMMKAATALASDGTLRSPRLVSRIVSADGTDSREYIAAKPVKLLKESTAREMRSYMKDVTGGLGTGWRAFIEDIPLAVKTGTAQIIDPESGAYSDTDFIASCMAILPADSPSLVIYITIIKPKGESYLGGRIAAPYIRETAEALVNYLGIPRGRNPQISHSGSIPLPDDEIPAIGTVMPNLLNYSKRQILPLLLRDDLHFRLNGEGWVKRQSPLPGAAISADTVIDLEFE